MVYTLFGGGRVSLSFIADLNGGNAYGNSPKCVRPVVEVDLKTLHVVRDQSRESGSYDFPFELLAR